MNYAQVIKHFGSTHKAAAAIGVSCTAVWHWRKKEIPLGQQAKFETASDGKLKAKKTKS